MKQKDIVIIIAALAGGILLALLAGKYLSHSASQDTQVDVVPVIRTDFPTPSTTYFNSQAIDPTQLVNIGPNNSQQPFNSNQ